MKIILKDGTELETIIVQGGIRHISGSNRDALTFVFDEGADVNQLDEIFTEENCEVIKLVGEDGSNSIHTDYTIRVEMKTYFEELSKENPDNQAVNVKRTTVTMAQCSYVEKQLKIMADEVTNTQLALVELYEGVM